MGKALQVWGPNVFGINTFFPLGGVGHNSVTESRSQFKVSEGATFSGLAFRNSVSGGTHTVRFRKNATNGTQVATRSGIGFAEDTTNSDTVVDGDLVNYHSTDTSASDPQGTFVRSNVEFTNGHGNFHLCSNASNNLNLNYQATRYFPLTGRMDPPSIPIANSQWKNRGYTSIEAIQVTVIVNDRTNNTTFRVNVNGTAVGATLTVAGGLTGLFEVVGLGVALASGDLQCVEWSSGAGAQNFMITTVGATFKSSGASESWGHKILAAAYTRTASETPSYLKVGGSLEVVAGEANARIKVGFACIAQGLRTYIESNTCTGAQTLKLFVNGVVQLTRTIAATATGWQENETDTFTLNDTDEVCLEVVGGTSGSCVFRAMGLTFGALGGQPFGASWDHVPGRVPGSTPGEAPQDLLRTVLAEDFLMGQSWM